MYIEHIIYSGALAILLGMVFYKFTGRDSSWIIIVCAFAPDLDHLAEAEGAIHNIGFMVIFSVLFACFLLLFRVQFLDAVLFSAIGFGAHLLEDAMVYKVGYPSLWPLSSDGVAFGVLSGRHYTNFFGIANTDVLLTGLVLLLLALLIRTYVEGPAWIRWYMPERIYLKVSGK